MIYLSYTFYTKLHFVEFLKLITTNIIIFSHFPNKNKIYRSKYLR
jgi:hypothetical protein